MASAILSLGHIQIAQVPGRHEPDSPGELNFPYIFELLESLGYTGYVGCEYAPKGEWACSSEPHGQPQAQTSCLGTVQRQAGSGCQSLPGDESSVLNRSCSSFSSCSRRPCLPLQETPWKVWAGCDPTGKAEGCSMVGPARQPSKTRKP